MSADAIAALRSAAEDPLWRDSIEIRVEEEFTLRVSFRIQAVDYDVHTFELVVGTSPKLKVAEQIPGTKLPPACPERHINGDGSFCLGWKPLPLPTDARSACELWALVAGFLAQQLRAAVTEKWPEEHAWPHGNAAAIQEQIEALEKDLPPTIGLRRCHEPVLVELQVLRRQRTRAIADFWKQWKHPCCNTMTTCPLRTL